MNELKEEGVCSTHPDAPHGFNRDSSHTAGRYVCDCEGWEPPEFDEERMDVIGQNGNNGEHYLEEEE